VAVPVPLLLQRPDSVVVHSPYRVDLQRSTAPVRLHRVAGASPVFETLEPTPRMCWDLVFQQGGIVRLEELPGG
jgi:hypothetical protein